MSETQYDNVFIFGAGASVNAKIPLLAHFIDTMRRLAVRGKTNTNAPIPDEHLDILRQAKGVCESIEAYHSRASFSGFNIEDVLSILAFEAMGGTRKHKERFELLTQAIRVTIELSTIYPHQDPPDLAKLPSDWASSIYSRFWGFLIEQGRLGGIPAIITFNYDLVLERTLWMFLHRRSNKEQVPAVSAIALEYSHPNLANIVWHLEQENYAGPNRNNVVGVRPILDTETTVGPRIPLLKLHGSLNWPSKKVHERANDPLQALDSPLILPPVFNKTDSSKIGTVWSRALNIIRKAHNLIIVGYSMPQTDVYMQHFLRTAVGPAHDLDRVTVFDPILLDGNQRAEEMEHRYCSCFSPHFRERINFRPEGIEHHLRGSFQNFVRALEVHRNDEYPKNLLYTR